MLTHWRDVCGCRRTQATNAGRRLSHGGHAARRQVRAGTLTSASSTSVIASASFSSSLPSRADLSSATRSEPDDGGVPGSRRRVSLIELADDPVVSWDEEIVHLVRSDSSASTSSTSSAHSSHKLTRDQL